MPAQPPDSKGTRGQRFLPVHIDSLDAQMPEMDLWIRHVGQSTPTLYRAKGVRVSGNDIIRLREQRIQFLYIAASDHAVFRQQLVRKLDGLFNDKSKADAERARLVRANCVQIIEDVLALRGQAEPIEAVADIARVFSTWVSTSPSQFSYLLDMASHDFFTSTHMINVGAGCGMLIKELRPDEPHLFPLAVQGGLLHDIGKRGIPEAILNKGSTLALEEWEQIKRHPQLGYDELSKHPGVASVVLEMARDHHERLDGKGYPAGKQGHEISFAAKLCTVVDIFDAMTSTRPYKGPTHPLDAIRLMEDCAGTQIDGDIFKAWRTIIERMLEEDPSRIGTVRQGDNILPLTELVQNMDEKTRAAMLKMNDLVAMGKSGGVVGSERRKHSRFDVRTPGRAKFLRQIKPYPVEIGELFEIDIVDVSRGGVGIETGLPMARGDLLQLYLRSKEDGIIERLAQVVRVRSKRNGKWVNGLCFVDDAARAA